MSKAPTLSDLSNLNNPSIITTVNANNDKIELAFQNTLSLDGSLPNAMGADLDMDGNDVNNVATLSADEVTLNGVSIAATVATAVSAAATATADTFENVTSLLADNSSRTVGTILRTREEGFAYEVAASDASDHQLTTAGSVKLYVILDNGCLTPTQLGVTASPSFDATTLLQLGLDYLSSQTNGGTLRVPQKTYYVSSLRLPPYVNIVGETEVPFVEGQSSGGSQFRQIAGTVGPLLYTDVDTDGSQLRSAASSGNEGNQYYYNSVVENLHLNTRSGNSGETQNDALYLERTWGVTVRKCVLTAAKRSFAIRVIDCNVLRICDNSILGPSFIWSMADSFIEGNSFGGGTPGLSSEIHFWPALWLAGSTCWKNTFSNNIVFNNTENKGGQTFTFTASGEVLTLSGTHFYNDGDPVILETTGALPTGVNLIQTYFVKRVSSTQIKLAEMKKDVVGGVFVSLTGGSGTHTVVGGANANLFLSQAQQNSFVGGRYDQAFGSGIILRGAENNTFVSGSLQENGLGSGTTVTAISIEEDSINNSFKGLVLVGNSTQTIGVSEVGTLTGNVIDVISVDHSGGNVVSSNIGDEFLYLGASDFTAIAGNPVIGLIGGSRRAGWLLDAASEESIGATLTVPEGWNTLRFVAHWVNAGGGSGDVALAYNFGQFADGVTIDAADAENSLVTISTAVAQDVLASETFASSGAKSVIPRRIAFLRIKRVAADAGDTLANDVGIIGVRIEKVT
jgi:hypothetical protein